MRVRFCEFGRPASEQEWHRRAVGDCSGVCFLLPLFSSDTLGDTEAPSKCGYGPGPFSWP